MAGKSGRYGPIGRGGKHFMAAWAVYRPWDGLISILFDFGCTFKGRIHLNFKELNFEV